MPHPATKLPRNICFEISVENDPVQPCCRLMWIAKVKKRQTSSVIVTKSGKHVWVGHSCPTTWKVSASVSTLLRTFCAFLSALIRGQGVAFLSAYSAISAVDALFIAGTDPQSPASSPPPRPRRSSESTECLSGKLPRSSAHSRIPGFRRLPSMPPVVRASTPRPWDAC